MIRIRGEPKMIKRTKKYIQSFSMLGMLLSFLGVTIFSMIYMAKDNNYYNTIFEYFNISTRLYSRLIYMNIGKEALINGMNICSILFILCNYIFSQSSFSTKSNSSCLHKGLRFFLCIFPLVQLIVYNPLFIRFLYFGKAGFLPDPVSFRFGYGIFHQITVFFNLFTLLCSAGYLIATARKKEPIRELRLIKWLLAIIDICIVLLYFYMFFSLPDCFLWLSRSMDYTAYLSLEMPPYIVFMRLLPFLVVLLIVILWVNFYRYNRNIRKMNDDDFVFSSIISSSEISTRAFSHYVKNELLGILSETDFMIREKQTCPERLEHIRKSCLDVYERLDALQRNSNRIVLNQSRHNILDIISDTLERYREFLQKSGITVVYESDTDEAYVFCDSHYIREVFRNLINNAADAMVLLPEGHTRKLIITAALYENEIQIRIGDTGPGISPAIVDRLFEPFASTKPTKYNWGLGLSFVKRIVKSHDGKIEAANTSEGGAEFTIYFPILKSDSVKQSGEEKQRRWRDR